MSNWITKDAAFDLIMSLEARIEDQRRAVRVLEESIKSTQATVNLLYKQSETGFVLERE